MSETLAIEVSSLVENDVATTSMQIVDLCLTNSRRSELKMAKTFDQQKLNLSCEELLKPTATVPNQAFEGAIALEPNVHSGVARVRVTARDKDMNTLWGANVSEHMLDPEGATDVAFYSELRALIRKHLPDARPQFETTSDPYESIAKSLESIGKYEDAIRKKTVGVKKKSPQTDDRSAAVANLLLDTLRIWNQELPLLGVSKETENDEAKQ